MDFNSGVHFKMTTKGSRYSSKANRGHVIAHAERYGNNDVYYKNNNVDLKKSNLNDYYTIADPYQLLSERFNNKAVLHDRKAIAQDNFQLVYGSYVFKGRGRNRRIVKVMKSPVTGYLHSRWLKPLRTVPFKFCTMKEKAKLLKLCQLNGIDYVHYAKAVNRGYRSYVNDFNKSNKYMKITRCDTNLDEAGGDHGHIEYLGLGSTAKGKPSLSFNNAVKHTLPDGFKGGYKKAMSAFRKQQSELLLKHLSKSFQIQGLNVNFKMVSHARNPKTYINNMALYKQTMRAVDKAKVQAQEAHIEAREATHRKIEAQQRADKSFQRLKRVTNSLIKQNANLKAEARTQQKLFNILAKKYIKLLKLLKLIQRRL